MLENFTTLQLLLLGSAGVAAYFFWFKDGKFDLNGVFASVKSFFGNVKLPSVPNVIKHGDKPTTVEIVERWETLRNTLSQAGNTDAVTELDELWKLLNPNTAKKEQK